MSRETLPVEETRRRIAARLVEDRCDPTCKTWEVFDGSEIAACDACWYGVPDGERIFSDDAAALPEARLALARELIENAQPVAEGHGYLIDAETFRALDAALDNDRPEGVATSYAALMRADDDARRESRTPEDRGPPEEEQAWVVVLKRVHGDTPKLCKCSGERFYLTLDEAVRAHRALDEGLVRNAYEVREVIVTFPAPGPVDSQRRTGECE